MADVQQYFEQFHDKIRIDFDDSEPLRDKRKVLVDKIKKYLRDNKLPVCTDVLQGSYANEMKTGVVPIKGLDYDIDVGLRFPFDEDAHTAKVVRSWIKEAVKDHTKRGVEHKGPCDRVSYEPNFHVDLVSYAVWTHASGIEHHRLAHKTKGWREADPKKLLEEIKKARESFQDLKDGKTKTDQFRRSVRCLRRWIDVIRKPNDPSKPTGLAFILLCRKFLQPSRSVDGKPDDRRALEILTNAAGNHPGRIVLEKPTPEYEDMLGHLSDTQMDTFKEDLRSLHHVLCKADAETDPVKACEHLVTVFGDDFPVPAKKDTGKATPAPAIITSSSSA